MKHTAVCELPDVQISTFLDIGRGIPAWCFALQVVSIQDPSSAAQPNKTIVQAEGFRLFATQNPNAGFFKGRREKLSAALLDRFTPVVFKQLPSVEWQQVVMQHLLAAGMTDAHAVKLAGQLVTLHEAVQIATCSNGFPEVSQTYGLWLIAYSCIHCLQTCFILLQHWCARTSAYKPAVHVISTGELLLSNTAALVLKPRGNCS